MQKINFKDPAQYGSLFNAAPVRNSVPFQWGDLYFERREEAEFETLEHSIDGHYLMVKLNPWSIADRRIDGKWQSEVQRRGSVAYVPDGCRHSVRYQKPLGALCFVTLSRGLVDAVADELNQPRFSGQPRFAKDTDPTMLSAVEAMDRELREGNPNGVLFAQNYSKLMAAHLVLGYGQARRTRPGLQNLPHRKMKWLDDYIDANLAAKITLEELAQQVDLSPYYFTRIFKATAGMAPYQYVLHKRIEFARACLKLDQQSIQDVALACGFSDASQFSRQFTKLCQQTPSAYRQTCRTDGPLGRASES